jgi:predicted dehydrogenase
MHSGWRIGLMGAGWVSRHHLLAWQAMEGAQVMAVCDPDVARAHQRAAEFRIANVYASAEQMLAAQPLDAIDIAAPRECHAALVRLAASHGLPVLCQKPLAPTLREAELLVQDVAGKIRWMVHENWRFRPFYRKAKEWIDEERIGRMQQCLVKLVSSGLLPGSDGTAPLLERQPFLGRIERLMISEVLIHHIDTLRYLFGPLELITASTAKINPALAGEDCASLQLRTARGRAIIVWGSLSVRGAPVAMSDDVVILGERGSIFLEKGSLKLAAEEPETVAWDPATAYQAAYNASISHFIDCLESGKEFETGPQDNLETLRIVERAYTLAQATHSAIVLDPKSFCGGQPS